MKVTPMLRINLLFASFLIIWACAKPAAEEAPSPEAEQPVPAPAEVAEMPLVEEEAPAEEMPAAEEPVIEEEAPLMPLEEPATIPTSEYEGIEQEPVGTLHPDSTSYAYMIRPNDYLIKIAYKEYGNPYEWRKIYRWNREKIGDNPNLIYPYRELDLYKPEEEHSDWSYDYLVHVIEPGESLWSIAGDEYGDALAWIVIFWDNEDVLGANGGRLKPGMELRIRTNLWPSY
ncbi:LysM peptidoglycan-binding domain-containing protein [Candidatus Neomarinimicrobiota bacterium]